jgi:hypothetical protein
MPLILTTPTGYTGPTLPPGSAWSTGPLPDAPDGAVLVGWPANTARPEEQGVMRNGRWSTRSSGQSIGSPGDTISELQWCLLPLPTATVEE